MISSDITRNTRNPGPGPRLRGLLKGRRAAALAAVAVLAAVAGCSASSTPATQSGSTTQTLSMGIGFQPNSMDPAKINAAFEWYSDLAYDPLIYLASDGALQPRLATSWGYVGSGNRVFEIHLRPGVKFSDGTALTASVVKANIAYYRQAGGSAAAYLSTVTSVDAVGPLTVRLTLSAPNPVLPLVFTQNYQAGNMISGAALKHPQELASQTFGAGPYVLDTAQTVAGDYYTYTPNPAYWNKTSIAYGKVVIKVLPNANTAMDALTTGQVDVIQGDQTTANTAKSDGLNVSDAPHVVWGLALADRSGKLVPALGNAKVRQALNYAVNREQITTALFGKFGTPTEQLVLPGQDGYDPSSSYAHDPAKAKSLLAQAGYPNGFTLPVVASPNGNLMAQAIAADLQAIGVHLQITTAATAVQYLADVASRKYPAYLMGYGTMPVYLLGPGLFMPDAAQFNPFSSSDPTITSLYTQAAAASPTTRQQLDREIITQLETQAWFVPVTFGPVFMFSRPTVTGVQITGERPSADPVEWRPSA